MKYFYRVSCILFFCILNFSSNLFAQDYPHIEYPAVGIGFNFGISYYFPNDINDYIDLSGYSVSREKEHLHTGIGVGLTVLYAPNKQWEFCPEFNYLYSRRNFNAYNLTVVASYKQLGGTIFYRKQVYPGIFLRFGCGLARYSGTVSWQSDFQTNQNWEGAALGIHGAGGGELVLSKDMTVSLLLFSRFAKIPELTDDLDRKIKQRDGSGDNIKLNFSGFEVKAYFNYYL